jgi:hypothetical protein
MIAIAAMASHPDDGLPLHAQIANAEFRLAFLRGRRETILRQGRMAKRGFLITLAIAAVLVPYLAITTQADPLPALFITAVVINVTAALMWMYRDWEWKVDANKLPGRNRYTFYPAFVEEAIKEHEKRLAELRAKLDHRA